MILRCQPLTPEAFAPFGSVLETDGREGELINQGLTRKFADLARLEVDPDSALQICIYSSEPIELPFALHELECHPLACQAFMPLHDRPFPVVVAPAGATPGAGELQAFITNGRQGVNLRPGTWHHHQLSLEQVSDYLVIERATVAGNLETCRLQEGVLLQA